MRVERRRSGLWGCRMIVLVLLMLLVVRIGGSVIVRMRNATPELLTCVCASAWWMGCICACSRVLTTSKGVTTNEVSSAPMVADSMRVVLASSTSAGASPVVVAVGATILCGWLEADGCDGVG